MTRSTMAEFARSGDLLAAIRALRDKGYRDLEAYSPYPIHGIDDALEARASGLPAVVLVAALSSGILAYALQWLLNAFLYPLNVGARPAHFPLSFVPITFEMSILFASITCFACVLWLGRLLRLWQPLFEVEGIASITRDGYWVQVRLTEADESEQLERLHDHLRSIGATRVVELDESR